MKKGWLKKKKIKNLMFKLWQMLPVAERVSHENIDPVLTCNNKEKYLQSPIFEM